jgi:hypothetical protein
MQEFWHASTKGTLTGLVRKEFKFTGTTALFFDLFLKALTG